MPVGEATVPMTRRVILGHASTQLAGTMTARLMMALATILLARVVGPEGYGQYAAAMTLAKLTSVLFSLGLDTWLLRTGAYRRSNLATFTGTSLAIKGVLGLPWILLLVLTAPAINPAVFTVSVVALCAAIAWLEELALVAWTTFQARLEYWTASWLLMTTQGLVLATVVLLAWQQTVDLNAYLVLRVAVTALGAALAIVLVARRSGIRLEPAQVSPTVRAALPFAGSAALAAVYGSADVVLIAFFLTAQATGLYAPASTLITMLYLIPAALYNVLIPVLSEASARNSRALVRLGRWGVASAALLGLTLGAFFALGAPKLVSTLLGPAYAETAELLRILSIVLALHSVSFGAAAFLTAVGRQDVRLLVQAVAATTNLAIILLVIETQGLTGVAWAFVASEVVLVLGYLYFYAREDRRQRPPGANPMAQAGGAP